MIRDPELRRETRRDIERIDQNLKKADLTYERLARALAGKDQVGLQDLFQRTMSALEVGVRALVQIHMPANHAVVWGDGMELVTALTELLHVIATQNKAGAKISLSGKVEADHVTILLQVGRIAKSHRDQPRPHIIEQVAETAKIAAKSASNTSNALSQDAFEGARWRVISEGGDLFDTGNNGSGRQIKVRLRRASTRRSNTHE
jgi:hypothetical protein